MKSKSKRMTKSKLDKVRARLKRNENFTSEWRRIKKTNRGARKNKTTVLSRLSEPPLPLHRPLHRRRSRRRRNTCNERGPPSGGGGEAALQGP